MAASINRCTCIYKYMAASVSRCPHLYFFTEKSSKGRHLRNKIVKMMLFLAKILNMTTLIGPKWAHKQYIVEALRPVPPIRDMQCNATHAKYEAM